MSWRQQELLRRAVAAHAADLVPILDSLGTVPLDDGTREKLRLAVADELLDNGLDEAGGHTDYGLELEDVIDLLGHL
jgi:hypothetical protein